MEFAKILKQEKVNELASEKMTFTSTLKSLTELGYEYVKDLGIGQFGKVVEVINPSTKSHCALKIVKEEAINDGELYVWPSLCHQNVVKLLGFNYIAEDRTFIFITKKYPSSLDEKLGDAAFIFDLKAFERAISWIKDIAMGIAYLHEKRMAHMDIKTNNVLITGEDRALVTDFGSLSSTEKKSSAYTSPVPYRPPETYGIDGSWEAVDGLKYDSWTIGMLCIRVFTRESFSQMIRLQKSFWPKTMYPRMFEILLRKSFATKMRTCFPRSQNCLIKAKDVLNLIKSCLQLDPKKRIAVKDSLNHALFGGEEFYEWEENNPWNKKCECEEIERLICELKLCQRNTSESTKEFYESSLVKEMKADVEDEMLTNDKIGQDIKVDAVEKVEKEMKVDFVESVIVSNGNIANCDGNESDVPDKYVKNSHFRDLERERPEEGKKHRKMPVEVILSAHALYKDVKSQRDFGKYLKVMDSQPKQVPQTKRTNKGVDWAREKKNSLSNMFARFRSTKL